MSGLVERMQQDAVDHVIAVSTLLRKAKLAAAKLQLPKVETWVERELNGYPEDEPVPAYRKFVGVPKAHSPVHGWINIQAQAGDYEQISNATTGQSLATLENIVSDEKARIFVPLDRGTIDQINQQSRFKFAQMGIFISRPDIVSVIDRVRNLILDWSIELERNGIIGEGLTFSQEEKDKAIHNITIQNFTGFLGNGNTVSALTGGDLNS